MSVSKYYNREYVDICKKKGYPISPNAIGQSGEAVACALLEYFPIFRVCFVDGKEPIIDVYFELMEENTPYQALAQIKTTSQKPYADGSQKTPVSQEKYKALLNRPLPTYVFSVDINKGSMIFIPAFQSAVVDRVGGTHKVDFTDLGNLSDEMDKLRDDIVTYWHFFKLPESKNTYKSSL